MFCYPKRMIIGASAIEDELVAELVRCGDDAHRIAQAHHNEPGANGFTFGTDRYQRGTELAKGPLERYGFRTRRNGAGLVATRDNLELQFATAKGTDLTKPANFDADSSLARRRAGSVNCLQPEMTIDGRPLAPRRPILHVVWSGNPALGLTAVHIGQLTRTADEHLDWATLERVDLTVATSLANGGASAIEPVPSYTEQPEPALMVDLRPMSSMDEN